MSRVRSHLRASPAMPHFYPWIGAVRVMSDRSGEGRTRVLNEVTPALRQTNFASSPRTAVELVDPVSPACRSAPAPHSRQSQRCDRARWERVAREIVCANEAFPSGNASWCGRHLSRPRQRSLTSRWQVRGSDGLQHQRGGDIRQSVGIRSPHVGQPSRHRRHHLHICHRVAAHIEES